ncbi:MAG: hypothetical protein ACK5MD_09970 [Flavobacteriales bacterium]
MGKLTLKRAHLSEVNLLTLIDKECDINFKNLEEHEKGIYLLKPSDEYYHAYLILARDEDQEVQAIHISIPLLWHDSDFVKIDTEDVFNVEMLIKEKTQLEVLYSVVNSFKYVGFQDLDCTFEEYAENIERISGFILKERNQHSIVFENKDLDLEFIISDAEKLAESLGYDSPNQYPSHNVLKYQLFFKNPEKNLKKDIRFAHLEHDQFLLECKVLLESVVKGIELKTETVF